MTDMERSSEGALERALRNVPTGDGDGAAAAALAARRLADRIAADGLAEVTYAPVDSPFGPLLALRTRRGLLRLAFPEESADSVLERVAERVSPRIVEAAEPLEDLRREIDLFCELFARPAVMEGLRKFVESTDAHPYLP